MKNITARGNHYGKMITIQQVNKTTARKLFGKGEKIFLQSSNMQPFGYWQSICEIVGDEDQRKSEEDFYEICKSNGYNLPTHPPTFEGQFDRICNEFSYYNCDSERGNYIHFYKRINNEQI